ncbi:MAG: peptide chain release factor N(5)-glutamine methyltransferase [Myxococcales bacterium]|nr:peptide chain release factor N(5)-glutamine methyltransferase [Myxococcales bacterium]
MSPRIWTTLEVLRWTGGRFAEQGIESARVDAELLLAQVLGTTRVGLYTAHDQPLGESELAAFRELVKRRLAGEPVAYLRGEQEFWSLPLHVDARVLIPRPDTETLVEVVLRAARMLPRGPIRIADVCTGSGAVAIALARELPEAQVVATDLSRDALDVARRNVARHAVEARVTLREGDLTAPLDGEFAIIAANPPYVAREELASLAVEVRCEPRGALDGGPGGLDLIARLVAAALPLLTPGGTLAIEHGATQGAVVRELCGRAGLVDASTANDLAGHERVTSARRSSP